MIENVKIMRIAIGLTIWAQFTKFAYAFLPGVVPGSQIHLASTHGKHPTFRSLGQMHATPSRRRPRGERSKGGTDSSSTNSIQVNTASVWRLFNVDVSLSEDEGKDSVNYKLVKANCFSFLITTPFSEFAHKRAHVLAKQHWEITKDQCLKQYVNFFRALCTHFFS